MLIHVLDGDKVVGDIEAEIVPSVGDTFWWKTSGPYEVQSREWHLPVGYVEEKPYVVTLRVKEMNKSKPRIRQL